MKYYKLIMKRSMVETFEGYVKAKNKKEACNIEDPDDICWEECGEWTKYDFEAQVISREEWEAQNGPDYDEDD